ncbi:Acetolactate synthase large subunit [uncultured Ruminococcus sp.]|uniref:Acetolactate synthase n=1 Tax=Massiliimalia timonensis TaxID=1987501 RepID=A0A8J6PCX3_9FIRM|nr:biosynthetic-type acetolactate synthase large subunit [Massiliimalia timonensis]MBC8611018.1 biosynthetic-type acetolactate synthase large subunit [Massiliimalia timonensis]MBS7174673.1 biosynthetic-type acetolactate synthase large subunit [Clostridiales bacterium]SCH10765.1 Acetolactate synthase large subunit [uncultured Clostridium sp.]SCI50174.1 Acetolactate synthase large subunit [uncultured Ruminococcus sp.]
MITVAQAMVKCLEEEQTSVVFGYPGAAIGAFYDALSHSEIQHILVRHEQMAAHAASGYARMSERPAVCIATSGPGALNLITGIATAYMDSVPMVVITGQVSCDILGSDGFQEADITGAVEPFIKYSYIVKDPDSIGRIFKEAFYLAASGRPGPVLIDVPMDIQTQKIQFSYPETVNIRGYKPTIKGHPGQIKRVAIAMRNAKCPVICAGGGVFTAKAQAELSELIEKTNIPLVTTMMGIGAVNCDNPLNFGMLGMHGVPAANHAVQKADLLILIGARASDRSVMAPKIVEKHKKVVHIDIDPAEIGKNLAVDIPLVGDIKAILQELNQKVTRNECTEWQEELREFKNRTRTDRTVREGYINPKLFMNLLSTETDPNALVVADVGQNQIWTANHCGIHNGRFMTSGGMGTMGYSIPAAEGAKLADPKRQVVSVCGDGSFQMQMMELGTISYYHINVKMVVMNNNYLGMVKELQDKHYAGNETAVHLGDVLNICKLAQAYGIPSKRLTDMSECKNAIAEMMEHDGPYLLECMVSPDESTL